MEERATNVGQIDVFSRLLMDRIIFLGSDIDTNVSNIIQAQLLYLDSESQKDRIQLYINSVGGNVFDGLGIYDTMEYISAPITTICTGMAASMASVLLSSGQRGERMALPHARIMIHQASGQVQGTASEIKIYTDLINDLTNDLYEVLAKNANKDIETIRLWCHDDKWMTATEAMDSGFIDKVITKEN
jgi:ATP-dependent Clp protease protease subunit